MAQSLAQAGVAGRLIRVNVLFTRQGYTAPSHRNSSVANRSAMNAPSASRRRFLVQAVVAAAAVPFVAPALIGRAQAQALKPLPADNATAVALAYVADAKASKHASFKPGSNCGNCQFFTAATGACTLFPGFSVPAAAWCSAWAKKA